MPYVPYLREILQRGSAVLDNEDAYERYLKNETIAFLLVYRYERNISILDDLRMEQTRDSVDEYNVFLAKKYEDMERLRKLAEKMES